jgi:hypothetical protein
MPSDPTTTFGVEILNLPAKGREHDLRICRESEKVRHNRAIKLFFTKAILRDPQFVFRPIAENDSTISAP